MLASKSGWTDWGCSASLSEVGNWDIPVSTRDVHKEVHTARGTWFYVQDLG